MRRGLLKRTAESLCASEFAILLESFLDLRARVGSQGFHASMSHLPNSPYFPTSHKVPDILIAGTIHQVPFVAVREILPCEMTVWAVFCAVKP